MTSAREVTSMLGKVGVSDFDASELARVLYASDASLYRVEPMVVVHPRSTDDVLATQAVCRDAGVPLTSRGAGTSIAGNAIGPGVVIDFSRHLDRILMLDPAARTAVVEPGVVLAALMRAAAPHGLRFGPDPSTHNRATLGGMIGNNACGTRAMAYGRTSDNVVALDVVDGTGTRRQLGDTGPADLADLRGVVAANLETIRTEFGRFPRQVSGYGLEQLLPERGFDVRRALVGSEGTLGVVLGATVSLVDMPNATVLVVLGYPDMASAADAVPVLLPHRPIACEGIDARLVDVVRARGRAVPELPAGAGWLLVELGGANPAEAVGAAAALIRDSGAIEARVIDDPVRAGIIWRIREDGSGLASRTAAGEVCYPGFEDAAVPPAELGSYLRDFEALLHERGLTGLPYGHFGDGCLHIRIDFPLGRAGGANLMREFLFDAADLVVRHGGSLSGEHGDGRTRSELLPRMYSATAMGVMAQVKGFFDPAGMLNPGVVVDAAPITANLRSTVRAVELHRGFAYADDRGDLTLAVHRCNGVGKCRSTESGGAMCPSFRATRDEKDSTRGRARVLQEVVTGRLSGWDSPELAAALDLCLSCKACASECPTGVDLSTYRAEALNQRYRHRLRPRLHYSLGWLPIWLALAAKAPRLANLLLQTAPGLCQRIGGIDRRRKIPLLARRTFRAEFADRTPERVDGPPVMIFVDPFTDHFAPNIGLAAVRVLETAGYQVRLSSTHARCALTLISTGQLDRARVVVERTVAALVATARAGVPIVGLEPSSTVVLRSDALNLVPGSDTRLVADAVRTLAELLAVTPQWQPPDLHGITVVAQPHCHHDAIMTWAPDADLLGRTGATLTRLAGCCGLAGDWGMTAEHRDVSVAIAELSLLPALALQGDAIVLADGFSCRTQIADLADRSAVHLAELLDR